MKSLLLLVVLPLGLWSQSLTPYLLVAHGLIGPPSAPRWAVPISALYGPTKRESSSLERSSRFAVQNRSLDVVVPLEFRNRGARRVELRTSVFGAIGRQSVYLYQCLMGKRASYWATTDSHAAEPCVIGDTNGPGVTDGRGVMTMKLFYVNLCFLQGSGDDLQHV